MKYFEPLLNLFLSHRDIETAQQMKKYMRNKFEFLGVNSPLRNKLLKQFLAEQGLPDNIRKAIEQMWNCKWRELQYAAMNILDKYVKKLNPEDITLLKFTIINKSWWDTVDFLAVNPVNKFFLRYRDIEYNTIEQWIESDNIWLIRSAIIYQLKRKKNIDFERVKRYTLRFIDSDDFFIQKAIAWILREYSKIDLQAVVEFLDRNNFNNFIRREALEYAKRKGLLKK